MSFYDRCKIVDQKSIVRQMHLIQVSLACNSRIAILFSYYYHTWFQCKGSHNHLKMVMELLSSTEDTGNTVRRFKWMGHVVCIMDKSRRANQVRIEFLDGKRKRPRKNWPKIISDDFTCMRMSWVEVGRLQGTETNRETVLLRSCAAQYADLHGQDKYFWWLLFVKIYDKWFIKHHHLRRRHQHPFSWSQVTNNNLTNAVKLNGMKRPGHQEANLTTFNEA